MIMLTDTEITSLDIARAIAVGSAVLTVLLVMVITDSYPLGGKFVSTVRHFIPPLSLLGLAIGSATTTVISTVIGIYLRFGR